MSNDPFGQFSNIFASEFAKHAGAAAMKAWQEALKSSFGATSFSPDSFGLGDGFKTWFGEESADNTNASSPFDYFQQFLRQFPGAGTAGLGAGSDFLQFGEYIQKYLDMFAAGSDPSKIAEQMSSAFQQSLDQLSGLSASPWMNLFDKNAEGMRPDVLLQSMMEMFGSNPFENGISPSEFFSAIGNLGSNDFTKLKSSAAIGPAREWQIAMQDVVEAADRYRQAQARMQQHTAATFDGASKQFWQELGHGEQELTSIRGIYDFWVDCAEEAYAENVMTDAYSRDFGESINSQANLKLKWGALLNRLFEMLNIPNRREVDGVIKNLSNIEMRLEEVEQQSNLGNNELALTNAAAIRELKKEIEALRIEIKTSAKSTVKPTTQTAKKRKSKKQASKKTGDGVRDNKKDNSKARKRSTKSKPKDSRASEFEIAKITNAN